MTGEDPQYFYVGARLDGVNICGQDLRGMRFTGLDRATIYFDDTTQLDKKFSRQLYNNPNAVQLLSKGSDSVAGFDLLQPQAVERISAISREKYAFDRAALIFRSILENRELGTLVVLNYPSGYSAAEAKAVSALRHILQHHGNDERALFNMHVAQAVDACLYHTSPYSRSDYFMAAIRHLADIPSIRPFVVSKVKKSKLRYLRENKELLEKLGLGHLAW